MLKGIRHTAVLVLGGALLALALASCSGTPGPAVPDRAPGSGERIPSEILLITSSGTGKVLGYDLDGNYLGEFATPPPGDEWLVGITFGADGDLYLSSYGQNAILRFDADDYLASQGMRFVGSFAQGGGLTAPEAITFKDGYLYVASSGTDAILKYDGITGEFIKTFASTFSPWSLAFGPDGNLYVDSADNNIYRFDGETGKALGVFASHEMLSRPAGIVFDEEGDLYVGSQDNNLVLRFNGITGEFLGTTQGGPLDMPWQLAFGPDGNLYVASAGNNKILVYDGNTLSFIRTFADGGPLSHPNGLAFSQVSLMN